MKQFILPRLISSLVSLFLFMTALFFVVQAMIPGDYVTQYVLSMSVEEREEMRDELKINMPLWKQYFLWVKNVATLDLGESFSGLVVTNLIKESLPPTILVFGIGTILAFMLGQWSGKMTAWCGPGFITGSTNFFSILFFTSFPPWFGFLVTYILQDRLRSLFMFFNFKPSFNIFWELQPSLWREHNMTPSMIMWKMIASLVFIVILLLLTRWLVMRFARQRIPPTLLLLLMASVWIGSWSIMGFASQGWDILFHMLIPIITYVLLAYGETMIIAQASMRDTMDEMYITTARAKGLNEKMVRDKHAARNAVLPVISRLAVSLPFVMGGIVIIETSIKWRGMGSSLTMFLSTQDIPPIMGYFLLIGLVTAVARLVLDIAHAYLDPRIHFSKS